MCKGLTLLSQNWPLWAKLYIAIMVSGLGFICQSSFHSSVLLRRGLPRLQSDLDLYVLILFLVGSALINPAYVQMSKDLDITVEQASYCTTIFILFSGISPMFVVPFSNVYGRRYIYLVCHFEPCSCHPAWL